MPNRIIKESICCSDSIKGLKWFEEVLFYRFIVNADDYGRLDGRTEMIQARCFPLRRDIAESTIEKALDALTAAGMVQTYEYDGHRYLQLTAWERHQSIRAKKSKFPEPPSDEINCLQVHADVPVIQSNPNPNPNLNPKESRGANKFTPPSLDEVTAYCRERGNAVDPERFIDFYVSKGWMVGKTKMKDWKACIRTWESRDNQDGGKPQTGGKKKSFSELIAERAEA